MSTRLETATQLATVAACMVIVAYGGSQLWADRHREPSAAAPPAAAALPTRAKVEPVDYDVTWPARADRGAQPEPAVVIMEFSDYQCPFCGRYARETFPDVKLRLVDTGKARYVYRNFPLEAIHPFSLRASEAGVCAERQGRFDEIHAALFQHQNELDEAHLAARAAALRLDVPAYSSCLSKEGEREVRRDVAQGFALGVSGTPTFFLGVAGPSGKLKLKKRVNGVPTLQILDDLVTELRAH